VFLCGEIVVKWRMEKVNKLHVQHRERESKGGDTAPTTNLTV
jgi:hypothetical protein